MYWYCWEIGFLLRENELLIRNVILGGICDIGFELEILVWIYEKYIYIFMYIWKILYIFIFLLKGLEILLFK